MANGTISGGPGDYEYREGKRRLYWIWWLIGATATVIALLPVVWKEIHWRALGITTGLIVILLFVLENVSIYWGIWLWNEQKMWGPKVLLVPIEEFLTYFMVAPFVIVVQTCIHVLVFKKKE